MNKIALEAIAFQLRSDFGNELAACFDKVFAFKAEYISDVDVVDKTFKYASKTLSSELPKVIAKHTNLIVSRIDLIPLASACGNFSIQLAKSPKDIIVDIVKADRSLVQNKHSLKDLREFTERADLQTGRVTESKFKSNKYATSITLDFGVSFFMEKLTPTVKPLESKELAAILLHEIGHMYSMFELASNRLYVGQLLQQLQTSVDTTNIVQEFKENKDDIVSIIDSVPISKNQKEISLTLIEKLSNTLKGTGGKISIIVLWLLQAFFQIIIACAVFINILKFNFAILSEVTKNTFKLVSSKDKVSEDTITSRNTYNLERIADEFVTRQGYSLYLSTGLDKIIKFIKLRGFTYTNFSTNPGKFADCLRVAQEAQLVLFDITKMKIPGLPMIYEDVVDRQKRILENTRAIFKDPNLPSDIRDYYLNICKEIEANIAKLQKYYSKVTPLNTLFNFVTILVNHLDDIIIDGKMTKDMENLLNQIDDMNNTKLFQQSYEIQQLFKNKVI